MKPKKKRSWKGWAVLWRSENKLDGLQEHFEFESCLPKFFRTRKEGRLWVSEKYGYIKDRKDLQEEPHGWKMPKVLRVQVRITEVTHDNT